MNPGVVAVASPYPLRLGGVVALGDTFPGDLCYRIDQLIDGDQLVGSQVEGMRVIGSHDAINTFYAVIHVHKGAGLLPIAPNLDLSAVRSQSQLARDGRRRLLLTSFVGAQGPVNVVKTDYPSLEAVILSVIFAEFFHK